MPTLSPLIVKLVSLLLLFLVIALIGCGVYWKITQDEKTITKQAIVNSQQAIQIQNNTDTIATDQAVAKIEQNTETTTDAAVKKSTTTQTAVQEKVEAAVIVVENKYTDIKVTPETIIQEQDEISTVQINGLWEAYCNGNPSSTECNPVTTPPNPSEIPPSTIPATS